MDSDPEQSEEEEEDDEKEKEEDDDHAADDEEEEEEEGYGELEFADSEDIAYMGGTEEEDI